VAAVASHPEAAEVEVPVAPVEAAASAVQAVPVARAVAAALSLQEAAASAVLGAEAEPAARLAAALVAPSPWTPHRTWPARSRLPATDESNVEYS
jgi:hypothetical protein